MDGCEIHFAPPFRNPRNDSIPCKYQQTVRFDLVSKRCKISSTHSMNQTGVVQNRSKRSMAHGTRTPCVSNEVQPTILDGGNLGYATITSHLKNIWVCLFLEYRVTRKAKFRDAQPNQNPRKRTKGPRKADAQKKRRPFPPALPKPSPPFPVGASDASASPRLGDVALELGVHGELHQAAAQGLLHRLRGEPLQRELPRKDEKKKEEEKRRAPGLMIFSVFGGWSKS